MSNHNGKIWGSTEKIFGNGNFEVHRIEVKPGGYCSLHCHKNKYNLFIVEAGNLDIFVRKNDYDLMDCTTLDIGDSTVVKPGEFHRFVNDSDNYATALEIYWVELDPNDIVREDVGGIE